MIKRIKRIVALDILDLLYHKYVNIKTGYDCQVSD